MSWHRMSLTQKFIAVCLYTLGGLLFLGFLVGAFFLNTYRWGSCP